MAQIFNFVPKSELDSHKNLQVFIYRCKTELKVFGEKLDWEAWKWPGVANFTKIGVHNQTKNLTDSLHVSFIDFAKAYFRYQQGVSPTGTKNELKALKAIEAVLVNVTGNAKITDLSFDILDQAAQKIREHYSAGAAYHGGRELERLAGFVSKKHLIGCDLSQWKSPNPRKRDEIQTGKIARARRDKKLPSDIALSALAEIFANNPTSPRDIFTSSIFAMLMCAPSRVSEILELSVDCEIEEEDSKGLIRYGWRFYSGKGYGGDIKWIPTEMVTIAKEAIKRIKKLTEEPRAFAKWIEKNPDKFFRHKLCPDVVPNELLTLKQVCQFLGYNTDIRSNLANCPRFYKLKTNNHIYTPESLWKLVMQKQPKDLPWLSKQKGIKFSNALFCMQKNLLHSSISVNPIILWAPENNIVNNDMSPRERLKSNYHKSIFDRWGYKNSDGTRIKLTSHAARHLLNTIAQRGGLSQQQIAKWSGRADPKQNRVYNHISEYEMVARAEELDTNMVLFGPHSVMEVRQPVSIQEFNTLEKTAAHVTEYGFCVHDFIMMPCEKYRDCLNCSEHVCIKGDKQKLSRIKMQFFHIKEQLENAEKAISEGISGADRWYESHKNTLDRLTQLFSILENPEIEDGSQIKLKNDKTFSPLRRAIEYKLNITNNSSERSLLKEMKILLGGGLG